MQAARNWLPSLWSQCFTTFPGAAEDSSRRLSRAPVQWGGICVPSRPGGCDSRVRINTSRGFVAMCSFGVQPIQHLYEATLATWEFTFWHALYLDPVNSDRVGVLAGLKWPDSRSQRQTVNH